jgi:hypothetical protein
VHRSSRRAAGPNRNCTDRCIVAFRGEGEKICRVDFSPPEPPFKLK